MGKIIRTTMFKIPNEEDLEAALAAYTKLEANNSKVRYGGWAALVSCCDSVLTAGVVRTGNLTS